MVIMVLWPHIACSELNLFVSQLTSSNWKLNILAGQMQVEHKLFGAPNNSSIANGKPWFYIYICFAGLSFNGKKLLNYSKSNLLWINVYTEIDEKYKLIKIKFCISDADCICI